MQEDKTGDKQRKIRTEKKKWKRIVSRILLALLILFILPPVIISIPFIQTFVVGQISNRLSKQLQTSVKIRYVNITFLNRVRLGEVYVEDFNKDTLSYISRLDAVIGNLPFNGRPLTLNRLVLADGIFCLRGDSTGTNIAEFVRKLTNPNGDDNDDGDEADSLTNMQHSSFSIVAKALELRNFRYTMQLANAPSTEDQPEGIIYKNMSVSNINLDADRITIRNDSLTFRVNDFSFCERSGLNMKRMMADTGIIHFGKEVTLKEFRIKDDYSDVRMRNLSLLYDKGKDFSDFLNKVTIIADIYDSQIDFKTLGYFAPTLNRIPVKTTFNGLITGHIVDLRSNSFRVETHDGTYIEGRFGIFGLPDVNNTMISVDLKHLDTRPGNITAIVEGVTGKKFDGREILDRFGNIHFQGTYTGLVNDFVTYGSLTSDLGDMDVDILFNSRDNAARFSGELAADSFNAGRLFNSPLFGEAGFNIAVNGTVADGKNDVFGKGNISLLEFNNYNYHNIELEGRLLNQSFDGKVTVSEPNIDLDFNGNIDLGAQDGLAVFNFDASLKHANLVKLNFDTRNTVTSIDANIRANLVASNILDHVGELTIDSLFCHDNQGTVNMGTIALSSYNRAGVNYLELKSDFMDAKYFGQDNFGGFIKQLQRIAHSYIPDVFPNKADADRTMAFESEFEAHIKDVKGITSIFLPQLHIRNGAELTAKINANSMIDLKLTSDEIAFDDNRISNLNLSCSNNIPDSLSVNLSGNLTTSLFTLNNFNLSNFVCNNRILTNLSFADSINDSGTDISFETQLSGKNEPTDKLLTSITMNESSINLFGQKWNLKRTMALIESDRINIEGFNINNRGQEVEISGTVSNDQHDTLKVRLANYNMNIINQYITDSKYRFGGKVSGEIDLCGLYSIPTVVSSVNIDTLLINSDTVGNVTVGSMWNNDKRRVEFTVRTSYDRKLYTSIFGHINTDSGEIYSDVEIKSLKIKIIEPILKEILSDMNGMINGTVRIQGTLKRPEISGNLSLDNIGLTVNYLQTQYNVNAKIDINSSKISMHNGQISDAAGNSGILNMNLTHDHFRDIKFDASANVRNFLSLNTKSADNPLFYGTAYTTGVVNLTGTSDQFNFLITAETSANSTLYIPVSSISQVKEYDFLSFKNDSQDGEDVDGRLKIAASVPQKSKIKLRLDLAVSPKSEIQILIDPKVGDILRAKGSGTLKIDVDPALDLFNITGDYSIEEGDYNFTLPNMSIISRKFTINRDSRIHFNGDIANAELNVVASYRERVSLAALFPDDSLRNYPVECQIFITGRMTNPSLKFNVEIHNIDPEKKAQFTNLVNTDEKMTRQFLSLLVLKSFLPEQNLASQDLGSASLMSNASELLSGQIGSLIALFNLPVPLDVSVDYNASAYNSSGAGFGIDISAQLFDRIILNGSASNSSTSNRSFVGDIEMEVLLGKNENTRFKVFSKSRDYFSDDMESNRNGIGLSYRSQFDRFADIFRRRKRKEK
ncbi:MAG: translocation/assembly module TamB [Prevotellaceae bacterium]|jgi:hypothetical protein|nr:translocation/assembly module TamB [Prevotellaceae bacterium]